MVLTVLSEADVRSVLDLDGLLPVVAEAYRRDRRGETERPPQPSLDVGVGLDGGTDGPAGNVLVQPGYVHGDEWFATKVASVHEGNPGRDLPTVHANTYLADAATGEPVAFLSATYLTNAKTACVGGLAARELAAGPVDLGVLGAGTQARWQTRAIALTSDLESVRVYSPSDSREECAADLDAELDAPVRAVDSPRAAVDGASVVVTATTATEPVVPGDALAPGALVVAIGAYGPGMAELDARTFERAGRVFAGAPGNVLRVGEVVEAGLDRDDLVHFGEALAGDSGRTDEAELLVVESAGSAALDAAAATFVLRAARREGVGTTVPL